jgi:hypothetical protein
MRRGNGEEGLREMGWVGGREREREVSILKSYV